MGRRRALSNEEMMSIVERASAGENWIALGAAFGVSKSTIRRVVVGELSFGSFATRLSPADEMAIVDAYCAGATMEKAGDLFRVERHFVAGVLRKYHVPQLGFRGTPEGFLSKTIPDDVVLIAASRYASGETVRAIAEELGYAEPTLRAAVKRTGVTRPAVKPGPAQIKRPVERILEKYDEGIPVSQIAKSFGIPLSSLFRTLRRCGIDRDPARRLTDSEKLFIVTEYAGGATYEKIGTALEVSGSTIGRVLRENEVALARGRRPRLCSLDESVFDVVTPVSARWVGFLIADGSLLRGKNGNGLAINLAYRDHGHVAKLRDFLKSTHAIVTVHRKERFIAGAKKPTPAGRFAYFKVHSKQISDALVRYGMDKYKGPERAPTEELENNPHFWAGVVDGDGSIGNYDNNGYVSTHFMLCGHTPLLESFLRFLANECLPELPIKPTDSGIFKVTASGRDALAIIKTLYTKASEAAGLERKVRRAEQMLRGELTPLYESPTIKIIDDGEL